MTLIDLDSVSMGDPVLDPAHLLSYLLARVGLDAIPAEGPRAAGEAFVEEYFAHVPADWRERFPVQCAAALLEVACGVFRHQRPGWRERMAGAIAEAIARLPAGEV